MVEMLEKKLFTCPNRNESFSLLVLSKSFPPPLSLLLVSILAYRNLFRTVDDDDINCLIIYRVHLHLKQNIPRRGGGASEGVPFLGR